MNSYKVSYFSAGFLIVLLVFISGPQVWAQGTYVADELIIKVKNSDMPKKTYGKGTMSALSGAQRSEKASRVLDRLEKGKGMRLKKAVDRAGVYSFSVRPGQKVEDAIKEAQADLDVEYAEPNYILTKKNMGAFSEVKSVEEVTRLSGTAAYPATGSPIRVIDTWPDLRGTAVPVVAVIDTGLDTQHSVFRNTGATWENTDEIAGNGIDDDKNGYVDDRNGFNFVRNSGAMLDDDGHGTHVSGIVLGVTQNIFAATLQKAKIKIMPLKFLAADGSGKTSDAVEAIYYAVDNGADVLNNSWGGSSYSAALKEAIAYAYDNGILFVAAAGNEGNNNDVSGTYPASYTVPNVITVAATTDADELAKFSNYGSKSVAIAAPGVYIQSTLPNNTFGISSGTSMATPFVSGVAALIKIERPEMLSYQLREIIRSTGDLLPILTGKVQTRSRLNVLSAFQSAKVSAIIADQPEYEYNDTERSIASVGSTSGCGGSSEMTSADSPWSWRLLLIITLLGMPLVIWFRLRKKAD